VLDLPICTRVGDRGPVHLDLIVIKENQKFISNELSAVVSDDIVRDPETENDVLDETMAFLEKILAWCLTSIHLVNLSTAMSRWVRPSGAFLKDPRRSRPHMANDHVMRIVWSSWAGA
jgi:hypothetical protein